MQNLNNETDYENALQICNELDDVGLDKILYWRNNQGLFFKEDHLKKDTDVAIEQLKSSEILDKLVVLAGLSASNYHFNP